MLKWFGIESCLDNFNVEVATEWCHELTPSFSFSDDRFTFYLHVNFIILFTTFVIRIQVSSSGSLLIHSIISRKSHASSAQIVTNNLHLLFIELYLFNQYVNSDVKNHQVSTCKRKRKWQCIARTSRRHRWSRRPRSGGSWWPRWRSRWSMVVPAVPDGSWTGCP